MGFWSYKIYVKIFLGNLKVYRMVFIILGIRNFFGIYFLYKRFRLNLVFVIFFVFEVILREKFIIEFICNGIEKDYILKCIKI